MDVEKVKNEFSLGEDSVFRFKFKDLVIMCAFMTSLAIAWNTIDNRITRTEERYTDLLRQIENYDSQKAKEIEKQEKVIESLKNHVQELERLIYTGSSKR